MKLRLVNTAIRAFGRKSGAQLWQLLGLPMVPAMLAVLGQLSLFDAVVAVSRRTRLRKGRGDLRYTPYHVKPCIYARKCRA